jgi:hypothetical protein
MLASNQVRTIQNVTYTGETGQNTVRLDFKNGEVCHMPNGGFNCQNHALAVMALLNASPSNTDHMEGKQIAVMYDAFGDLFIPEPIMNHAFQKLQDVSWSPTID